MARVAGFLPVPKAARAMLAPPLLVALLFAAPASAVNIDWVAIGNPGNVADTEVMFQDGTTGYGSVPYAYYIGTHEVTNAQYAEFLNTKAASDPLALYNTQMASNPQSGGIARMGSAGSYSYAPIAGREDMPVNFVSLYDTLRFVNWLNNGQGSGDTETGAYTLLGGTPTPSNGGTVMRNEGAEILLTSENEWYKAAYYDAVSMSYFDYPAGSNTQIACVAPTATPNSANCHSAVGDFTIKGSYTGSASPYGTFDQGGNVFEWNEAVRLRGGSFGVAPGGLAASERTGAGPQLESYDTGFRVAMIPGGYIPEPSTGLLVMTGLLGLACRQRRRGRAP